MLVGFGPAAHGLILTGREVLISGVPTGEMT